MTLSRSLPCRLLALFGAALVVGGQPQQDPAPLREAAADHFLVGTALMSRSLDEPALADLVATHFNTITAENELKPVYVQPEPGQFNFAPGEKLADFAEAHDMKLIGHTLLWHRQTPSWMFEDAQGNPLPREKALENLRKHIQTTVRHFKGRIHRWDVVNEALSDDADTYLRDTPALRAIGPDYIVKAFQFAHEADPDVELYYNDYSLERAYKVPKALRLVRELRAAGVEIDALGLQGHLLLDDPSIDEFEDALEAFRAEKLKIVITELDVDVLPRRGRAGADLAATEQAALDPYPDGLPPDIQQKLADRYHDLFALFARHADVIDRVTFWGISDGDSWLNNWPVRGRTNHPLLFDRNLQPKPAYQAALEALAD